ncbi:MAG: hypothetical protein QOE70_3821 [Chthoniobacter sp.]|jgi:hypothetical protein|nr:hypothetical protein [Chthoniobacter sp.]
MREQLEADDAFQRIKSYLEGRKVERVKIKVPAFDRASDVGKFLQGWDQLLYLRVVHILNEKCKEEAWEFDNSKSFSYEALIASRVTGQLTHNRWEPLMYMAERLGGSITSPLTYPWGLNPIVLQFEEHGENAPPRVMTETLIRQA